MRSAAPYLTGAVVLAMVLSAPKAQAQQDPMYSQYMFNTLAFNPAYAGSADVFTAMAHSGTNGWALPGRPPRRPCPCIPPYPVTSWPWVAT